MSSVTLEQSLQAYRVLNTPTQLSWKQHWVHEEFDSIDMLNLNEEDINRFSSRLKECTVSIMPSITSLVGEKKTLWDVVNVFMDKRYKNTPKTSRKVVWGTADGTRPRGDEAYMSWCGLQIIDMDINNEKIAKALKKHIFHKLHKCNWFMGVVLSSSGMGLHVYTKIAVDENCNDIKKRQILHHINFRHKYSFVYLACVSALDELNITKEQLLKWLDTHMDKPQQGAIIGYDPHPYINTRFFEDYIYVNFDSVEEIGHPDIDWVSHPDLKGIFNKHTYFDNNDNITIEAIDKPDLDTDTHTKIHYKHESRWRLANTLVKLYGVNKGFKYLRIICSNNIKDKELQADCCTAARHSKPIDVWAVNRLNSVHGFKIKLNIQSNDVNEDNIFKAVDNISNPTLIKESNFTENFYLNKNQYLGNIRNKLLNSIGAITLLEAGAGVGKTEMVKQLVRDGKKIIMVMPFTSTIKAKVENDKDWYYSYGNRKPKLDAAAGLCLTIDKFSHLNLMDVKIAGYDYIFIDESHLLFQSEYRPVMSKVIDMIGQSEVPVILMSGTPSGELVFFPDIKHLRVTKEDVRRKEFKVNLIDTTSNMMYYMCRDMARDIKDGKRILFPTNAGTLYSKQIKAGVTYFLQNDYADYNEVVLQYYKKSNIGEKFMDDINFDKTIRNTQILLCTTYLSVGVDILDKYKFSVYFADIMMPQEVEQFANRLRSNDLFINLYVAKNDAEGNSRLLHKYRDINFTLDEEEVKSVHSILQICNDEVMRNPIEYKYNSLVTSILHDNKFIEYNEVENKYYLNNTSYKVTIFERKYRDYVQQLPVLMKGMKSYGYLVSSKDYSDIAQDDENNMFRDVKNVMRQAYDDQVNINTKHIEELMDIISEDRLSTYREVLAGKYDIKKGDKWYDDKTNHIMIVKNIEMFEKVIPIYISLSKQYKTDQIREIFEFCRHKGGSYNFAAIKRIRTLVNILYNDKNERLDLPIKEFMQEAYEFSSRKKCKRRELTNFIADFAKRYADKASTEEIVINRSMKTIELLQEKFDVIFRCLVNISRPTKTGIINMERVELMWTERESDFNDPNKCLYELVDFLDITGDITTDDVIINTQDE